MAGRNIFRRPIFKPVMGKNTQPYRELSFETIEEEDVNRSSSIEYIAFDNMIFTENNGDGEGEDKDDSGKECSCTTEGKSSVHGIKDEHTELNKVCHVSIQDSCSNRGWWQAEIFQRQCPSYQTISKREI